MKANGWPNEMILLKYSRNVSLVIIRYMRLLQAYYKVNDQWTLKCTLIFLRKTFHQLSRHTGTSKLIFSANGRFL